MDQRILQLYTVLADGKSIRKSEVAKRFGVSERTIQRDLSELRLFLADMTPETGIQRDLVYDRKDKCYRVEPPLHSSFSNSEAYTVAKILLESRALNREELDSILEKLVECCYPPLERKVVEGLLNNERFLYLEPKHQKPMTDLVWQLGRAVDRRQVLEVDYYRNSDGTVVHRVLQPVGILFDSFYFYLIAYYDPEDEVFKRRGMKSQEYPNTYRIDRIEKVCRAGRGFRAPYENRFQEGEFRKRVPFMFTGPLATVSFWCHKASLEAVLDRLPTAVENRVEGDWTYVTAEVHGEGVLMWLRGQGEHVRDVEFKTVPRRGR